MTAKRLAYILPLLVLLAACAPADAITPADAHTPAAAAKPTATDVPDPTKEPEWVSLETAEELAQDPSWACVSGVKIVDGKLAIQAGGDYLTAVNTRGPYVTFEDNLGLSATLEVAPGDWAAFTIFGALRQGEWWEGIRRLDLSWSEGKVGFVFWDGTLQVPAISKSFPAPGASGKVRIGLRKQGERLIVLLNGVEIDRLEDPGLFPDNRAYLGANVQPDGKLVIHDISVEAERGKESTVQIVSPTDTAAYVPSTPALRELAEARGIAIGAAVAPEPLRCEPAYAQALGHEFNMLTTENAMKFSVIHPEPDRYSFEDADTILAFAEANDMRVRGHTLVWHEQLAAWVEDGTWTREELMDVLHEHITTVVGRYRGRVDAWDVVNEAITDAGLLRNTIWLRVIGPDYIELAFRWAHEADPDALLFYNDYACEELGCKSDAIYALVKDLVEKDVPIHGVGLQAHTSAQASPDPDNVAENMQRFADLGLEIHITEMDVRIRGEPTKQDLDRQAAIYRDVMDACLSTPKCTAFVTWGFTDRHSWIPSSRPGWGAALLFDESYRPKSAYVALRDSLSAP